MASETQWPLKFEQVAKSLVMSSRLNGSCPLIVTYDKLWWIKNIFWPLFSFICCYISLYSVIYHDFKSQKYADAIRNGVMSIVALTVAIKHLLLLRHRQSIRGIIDVIDKDYETAEHFTDQQKATVIKYARLGTKICKFWVVAALITGLLFPVKAIVLMGYYLLKGKFRLVPLMDLSYPYIDEYKNIPAMFWILFLSCSCFALYAATAYISFDPLVPVIVAHTCGQLELLSDRMLEIFKAPKTTQEINEQLKLINIKLMEIYRVIDIVQKNFVFLYEFVLKTTTFLLSFSAFQIAEKILLLLITSQAMILYISSLTLDHFFIIHILYRIRGAKHNGVSVEFVSFFFGSILHFYSPCYFSNLLMDKSEQLRQAIYSCGWELQADIRVRKTILLMLTRTTKSVVLRTVFKPVCLDTFAEMARQAYTIYNLMNAAWG